MILINANGANFCMKLPYFMREISKFVPKPCTLQNLRPKREGSGFSLLYLTVLLCRNRGGSVLIGHQRLQFSPPASEAAGSNLGPGSLCWKVGSYLPMPGDL